MKRNHKVASVIATAAALAFVTAPITSTLAQASSKVACYGLNSCKGKGSCKTVDNNCKGHNSCKGKGVKMMKSEASCKKAGGSVEKPSSTS